MSTDVVFIERRGSLVARIGKDIDHHTAAAIRRAIDTRLFCDRPEQLVLDFGSVAFMDSSGIGLIMGRYRLMSAQNGTLWVENAPKNIEKMIRLAGLDRLPIWNERNDTCETH